MIVGFNLIFKVPEVIHITCNMGSRDLPDMYALSYRALGIHIRQIPPPMLQLIHVYKIYIYIYYIYIIYIHIYIISMETESGHPDCLGHLDHFLPGSKWVSPRHTYIPDLDKNYLVIMSIENCNANLIFFKMRS